MNSGRTEAPSASHDELVRRRRRARLAGSAVVAVATVALALALTRDDPRPGGAPPPPERPAAACEAAPPPKADPRQYDQPDDVLKSGVDYAAIVETSCGRIELDLLEDRAPETVNNFVFLARAGYYDGLTWHRVVENFVIQTGDPDGINGHAPDGPGYTIGDEFVGLEGNDYLFGAVAMANAGQPHTGGSQFFIVVQSEGPAGLDPLYSLFGRVDGSRRTLLEIAGKATVGGDDPALMDKPRVAIYIDSIEVIER